MKRSWFGFFLLILLLMLALLSTQAMVRIHREQALTLEEAGKFALSGNWHQTALLTAQVRLDWDKWQLLRAALADHNPIEEIEAGFQVLEVYGRKRDALAFAALCQDLSRQLEAMGDAHALQLQNLL